MANLRQNRLINLPPEFDLKNVERLARANKQIHLTAFSAARGAPTVWPGIEDGHIREANYAENVCQAAQDEVLELQSHQAVPGRE